MATYERTFEGYTKVTRPRAERLFSEGFTLYLLPCNCSCRCLVEEHCWIKPVQIRLNDDPDRTFEKLVNSFEYYNCNREVGRYTHFYYRKAEKEETVNEVKKCV